MKKIIVISVMTVFMLTMSGCNNNSKQVDDTKVKKQQETTVAPSVKPTDNVDDEVEATKEIAKKLTDEEIAEAKKVALEYYATTIFKVNSMEYVVKGSNPRANADCTFMVNVSKGGEVQNPDRAINLDREGEGWKVVGEGY